MGDSCGVRAIEEVIHVNPPDCDECPKPNPKPGPKDPDDLNEICDKLYQLFLNAVGRNDFGMAEALKIQMRLMGCDNFFDDGEPDPLPLPDPGEGVPVPVPVPGEPVPIPAGLRR